MGETMSVLDLKSQMLEIINKYDEIPIGTDDKSHSFTGTRGYIARVVQVINDNDVEAIVFLNKCFDIFRRKEPRIRVVDETTDEMYCLFPVHPHLFGGEQDAKMATVQERNTSLTKLESYHEV